MVTTVSLNAVQVLALACFGLAMGIWIKKKISILDRLNIPASVTGGMVYALLALVLRDRYLNLEMDLVLRDILMVAFFTTVGMSASLRLLRVGGRQVVWFFGLATFAAVLQNVVGIGVARLLGLDPLLGIIGGSVSLTGGPATALAFGATFESMGVAGATTLGVAAATFGIVAGGLLGGYAGGSIIRRKHLKPSQEVIVYSGDRPDTEANPIEDESESERSPLLNNVIAIAIAMGVGTIISTGFENAGLVLPAYVGAMLAAAAIRNIDEQARLARISQHQVDSIGNVALNIFIVMALLTLRLWELVYLALPMILILVFQVALVWALCTFLIFRAMGKDYEAAVMTGGFCGFMLGTTANSLACMGELVEKYGPAPRAYIVVPIVGAFLIDFTNALVITTMANFFR